MRILTWNVNVLRTCLDYHPFSSMKKRNVEGLLDELGAEIACFQEHKTRRAQLDKPTACPGPYDAFYTFPRSKTGYSGVCTYVDARAAVPLRAEEGITGTLLGDPQSTMRPPWTAEERVGCYPDWEAVEWEQEEGAGEFDVRRLDMEGRAVVLDFGLFVLFNLYSPNETNDTRRPYKMNFLTALQLRVAALHAAGRSVVIVGDLNIMRAPIDSGEGGVRSSAEQHYAHPARGRLDDWCRDAHGMVDVVRERWPAREGMFTCWNLKLDARPANYGSRIDYVLVSPALRPWVKHADILPGIYGSDHCPVFVDLHESIPDPADPAGTLVLRTLLDPPDRPPSMAQVYGDRAAARAGRPEAPRFAACHWDEFSGRQRTLVGLWKAGAAAGAASQTAAEAKGGAGSQSPAEQKAGPGRRLGAASEAQDSPAAVDQPAQVGAGTEAEPAAAPPLSLARAAFASLDRPASPRAAPLDSPVATGAGASPFAVSVPASADPGPSRQSPPPPATQASAPASRSRASSHSTTGAIDLTADSPPRRAARPALPARAKQERGKGKDREAAAGQAKLAAFWGGAAKPASPDQPAAARARPGSDKSVAKARRASSSSTPADPVSSSSTRAPSVAVSEAPAPDGAPPGAADEDADAAYARALAEAEAEAEAARAAERASRTREAAPVWAHVFAKKKVPLCSVHHRECKDYIVKIPGPNKGKRFWLCSMPVGPGYDTGRSKRPRDEVNREYRCDFFLWDSATRREAPQEAAGR